MQKRLTDLRNRLREASTKLPDGDIDKVFYWNISIVVEEMLNDLNKGFGIDDSHLTKLLDEIEATLDR